MFERAHVSDRRRSPDTERRSAPISEAHQDRKFWRAVPATVGTAGAARSVLQLQRQVGNQAVGWSLRGNNELQRRSITPTQTAADLEWPTSSGSSPERLAASVSTVASAMQPPGQPFVQGARPLTEPCFG